MPAVTIKATDKPIRDYQATLERLRVQQGVEHEGGLRRAFGTLLKDTARRRNWVLVEELPVSGGRVRPDGTLRDHWQLPHGYWEAKDGRDDLEVEIRRKRERGYPFSNIIFEDTQSAVLFQNERRVLTADCKDRKGLAALLTQFYATKRRTSAASRRRSNASPAKCRNWRRAFRSASTGRAWTTAPT